MICLYALAVGLLIYRGLRLRELPGLLYVAGRTSAVVLFLREYLSTLVPWWQYALGGVYVLTILYLPGGLMSIPARLRQWRTREPGAGTLAAVPQ